MVRLRDIAEVSLDKGHDVVRAQADGRSAVIMGLDPTPTANPLEMAAEVRKMLPELERNLPDTIKMKLLYDATAAIDRITSYNVCYTKLLRGLQSPSGNQTA